jgi:hypothetical protein
MTRRGPSSAAHQLPAGVHRAELLVDQEVIGHGQPARRLLRDHLAIGQHFRLARLGRREGHPARRQHGFHLDVGGVPPAARRTAELANDGRREDPTLDSGLVAVGLGLRLPPGSAVALFAIGRAVGWIAHALEQRDAGYRPARRRLACGGGWCGRWDLKPSEATPMIARFDSRARGRGACSERRTSPAETSLVLGGGGSLRPTSGLGVRSVRDSDPLHR